MSMTTFARTDTSILGRWWWTVDRWILLALILLLIYGAVLTLAASPPAAARIQLDSFHFVKQQLILLPIAVGMMLATSLLSIKGVRRVSVLIFVAALILTVVTLMIGQEIKGARRWINLGGFSLQATEFLKPSFAVFAAWMFSQARLDRGFPGGLIATASAFLVVALLISQPDLGMAGVVVAIWFSQLFMAGLPLLWVGTAIVAAGGALFAAYQALPHVAQRINLFLDPSSGDTYQVDKSISAFVNGGLFGVGPGEGTVKAQLPDAHSDFIFAVAGEEFGLIACLVIVATYGVIVLRGFGRLLEENNLFVQFATVGLLVSFGLQAVINMASALHLMPTKGMTLPFISYGGSSLFALAFGMGLVMALTRRRAGVLA